MKKSNNVINVQLSDNQGKLHIRIAGWYIPKDFNDYSFELLINGKKTECSIEHITREDKLDELLERGLNRDCEIGFIVKADTDKTDINEIKFFVVDSGETKELASLDNKDIGYTIEDQLLQYNIDCIWAENTPDGDTVYRITGWVLSKGDISIEVVNRDNKKVDYTYVKCDRHDLIDNGYTEDKEKAYGFTISVEEKDGYILKFMSDSAQKDIDIDKELKWQRRVHNIDKTKRLIRAITPHNVASLCKYIGKYGFSDLREYVYSGLYGGNNQELIYKRWFTDHKVTQEELEREKNENFEYQPLISIIVPTYNTPIIFLKEMIDSVIAQSYGKWQLCIADGSQGNKELEATLDAYSKADSRIIYKVLDRNLGIAGNTNAALDMAEGEIVGLLDHDDTLEPNALYEVVKALQDKDVDVVYTEEDKILGPDSKNVNPNFKPDFNIDLLRSYNYITHFYCVKTELIKEVGGFSDKYDGAQDYDIILRTTEKAHKIAHVSKILYHWRMHSNSTAANPESKKYCHEAGRRAVEDHLNRMGIEAQVQLSKLFGGYRIRYATPGNPMISIVIPNKDHYKDLDLCVTSVLKKSTYRNFEIIIVENNSTEKETFDYYNKIQKEYDNVRVLTWEREFNYSAINNFGVKEAKGDYILLLNNDTKILDKDSLGDMLGYCMRPEVGIVGSKLIYGDGTIQHAGVILGLGGIAGHAFIGLDAKEYGYMSRAYLSCDYTAVTAACLMVPKAVFDEVGGLCEEYAVAFNDVDLCMKVRSKGYLVVYDAFSQWYHYESKSRGYEDTPEKQLRFKGEIETFQSKWQKELDEGDPYYNRNFPMTTEAYVLASE